VSSELRAVACLTALALGCAYPASTEGPAVTRASVVGGGVSPPGGIEDAVLLLRVSLDGGELVCSASLVAPNLAVTASHCVSHFVDGRFTCTAQGELVSTDENAGMLGAHFDAASIEFYDGQTPRTKPVALGAQVLSTLSETVCVNDVAFVVLDRDLSLPVLPLRLHGRARLGEPVTLVGYGFDDDMADGSFLDFRTQGRTRNATLVIEDVGPVSDGDATSTPPRTVVVEGPSGCIGDSGGPLMARETHALLGVDSLSDTDDCRAHTIRNFFTHVPDFVLLTADAFSAAGYEPTPEPNPDASSPKSDAGNGGAPAETGAGGATSVGGAETESPVGGSSATSGSAPSPSHATGGAMGASGAPDSSGGGAPASEGGTGTSEPVAGKAGSPTHARAPETRHRSGCSVALAAAPIGTAWPLVVLVSVLERIFAVRRARGRFARLR
jgi:hypothetical protein